MKVVLFCGGLATRLREHSDTISKPLLKIGYRPILWHLMRYYAHFGHRDFILCLGYRGDLIRDYFLNYNEAMSSDFTLHERDHRIELHSHDTADWNITFVDTGLHATIGERLLRVRALDGLGEHEGLLLGLKPPMCHRSATLVRCGDRPGGLPARPTIRTRQR